MSGIDWIIVVVFLLSIFVGILRGFIREALSITSWILAIWLAWTFMPQAGDYIASFIPIPAKLFRNIVGFSTVLVVTLFLCAIISYIISKLLVRAPIKGTDRVLGIFTGSLRAVAMIVVVLILARGIGMGGSDWWQNSKFIAYLEPIVNYIEKFLPELFRTTDDVSESSGINATDAIKELIETLPTPDSEPLQSNN